MDKVIDTPSAVSFSRYYHFLLTGCGLLAATMFASMAVLVCSDIILRNLTDISLAWTTEASEYLLMSATMLAAPWLLYCGDHIRIDISLRMMSARWRSLCERGSYLLGAFICAVFTWYSLVVTLDSAEQGGLVFKVLVFPEWWLNLPMIFCFTLLTLEFMRRLLKQHDTELEGL
ncbi:TRAP transporter small permease [Oceanisphaera ostreae]|uniref:TRAP transporter small permease protein n=1 Tax=Oceanisphaera ostreae TaxID=914151 RepID=A0ABW3KE33_9GAMM